jgi:Bacterial mobilisation protein (MobC)
MNSKTSQKSAATSQLLSIRLSASLKAEWFAWCKARGLGPSASLKGVIVDTLSSEREDKSPPASTALPQFREERGDPDEKRARFELRFTQSELTAVRARAEAEGIAAQLWVIHAARAQLTGQYHMPDEAIQVAAELRHELRSIGQNINQVARVLNTKTAIPTNELLGVMERHNKQMEALEAAMEGLSVVLTSYATRLPLEKVS